MVKKKSVKKKVTRTTKKSSKIDGKIIENFVALQKVLTHMSIKFDNLTTQISKLLDLFEISAKSLAKKETKFTDNGKDSDEFNKKLDNLAEQNKIIARGLTLLHEKESVEKITPPLKPHTQIPNPKFLPKNYSQQNQPQNYPQQNQSKNYPPQQNPEQNFMEKRDMSQYKKSISSERDDSKRLPEL